jgi:hypothetical protein
VPNFIESVSNLSRFFRGFSLAACAVLFSFFPSVVNGTGITPDPTVLAEVQRAGGVADGQVFASAMAARTQ